MKAKYYVLSKTLWQGDAWSAIAGPIGDLNEANKIANEFADNGISEYGQDLKQVILTKVVNTTEMRKMGISVNQALESIVWAEYNRHEVK
jgi:hypothetical protein